MKNKKIETFYKKEQIKKQEQEISTEQLTKKKDENDIFEKFLDKAKNLKHRINLNFVDFENLNLFTNTDKNINFQIALPGVNLLYDYSADFIIDSDNNATGALIYYNTYINDTTLICFTLCEYDSLIEAKNSSAVMLDRKEKLFYKVKFLQSTDLLFVYTGQKSLSLFKYRKELSYIDALDIFNHIVNFDVISTGDKLSDFKIVVSDIPYNIGLYNVTIEAGVIKSQLISIYDGHFDSRITDIKFLQDYYDIQDNIKLNYFGACSRDGFLKIFTTKRTEPKFDYKTPEIWITRFFYDSVYKILYFMVNLNEKILGINSILIKNL
jgi:hypothetical protein